MPDFFHVDRETKLHMGQELDLRPHLSPWGAESQQCFEEALPGGVSEWGWGYIYDATDPTYPPNATREQTREVTQRGYNYMVELIWDLVRLRWFSDLPSRMQAVFAYDQLPVAEDFRRAFCSDPNAGIYRLTASEHHFADGKWLTLSGTIPRVLGHAKSYWQSLPRNGSLPTDKEFLLAGRVTVAEQVG